MKKPLFYWITAAFLLSAVMAFAQKEVSVNQQTGAASVVIPIYTISRGAVTLPVNLIYSSNGTKVSDVENNAGIGWQVMAGGQITRTLRGLPDDVKKDNLGNARLGWLYNTNGTKINSFAIANDNNTATCTDETADINYINTNFGDLSDTEPDIFSINVPGLSCQFVFDNNHLIRTFPFRDVMISYATNATTGLITSFKVTNDQGITYIFGLTSSSTRQASTTNAGNISFFKTDYNQYQNGITYNSTWYLQTITDANNNGLTLSYQADSVKTSTTPLKLVQGAAGGTTTYLNEYTVQETDHPQLIKQISSSRDDTGTPWLSFAYSPGNPDLLLVQNIQGSGRDILFNYGGDNFQQNDGSSYYRNFLKSMVQRNCDLPMGYYFSYVGNNKLLNSNLPDTSSRKIDYWGYYSANQTATSLIPGLNINPSNAALARYGLQASASKGTDYTYAVSGSARAVTDTSVMAGALNQVTYASGGSTTISYEANDYYDVPAAAVVKGGGVRVKQVTDYDGLNTANNMVRTYTYLDPLTGKSSGVPVSLPAYAFTMPYSGSGTTQDLWNFSTVRSETDLSAEDESILYSRVKVAQAGGGSSLYEYKVPATYWDTSTADWSPTINYIARTNCSASDFTRNGIYSYPFAPNTNYDLERGLLNKVTSYNETGQEVSETAFTYQRSAAPVVVNALKVDDNITAKAYAKYTLYTFYDEQMTQKTTKVFDSSTLSQAQPSTTNYAYSSSHHKLPTRISTTGSDGSTKITNITYTKDYPVTTTTDSALMAIQSLKLLNVNEPVEKQYIVQRGAVSNTIGAELTRFKGFNTTSGMLYLPAQQLTFTAANGVNNFTVASSASGSFTNDSRYVPVANYQKYDYTGTLLSMDDNNRHVQSLVTDHYTGLPVAQLANAGAGEFAYTDFDSNTSASTFTVLSGSSGATPGRSGQNGLSLNTGSVMQTIINKNITARNYVFSCWVNTGGTAGTITVTLVSGSTNQSYTISVSNALTWKYYERKIPVTSISGSMTVSFQSSTGIGIDDILLYSDGSPVSTVAYDPLWHLKTAQTNTNGVTAYYSYDVMGRLQYVYDQDKNITLKKSYARASDVANFVNPAFTSSYFSNPYPNRVITFNNTSSTNACLINNNVTYSWNFGDGSAPVTGNGSITHSYTTAGTYTVTLTVSSPDFGQKATTNTITIATPPASIPVTYLDNSNGATVNSVKFLQGSTVIYNFSSSDLLAGTTRVIPDQYNVVVSISGTTLNFNSFTYIGRLNQCYAKQTANPSVFSITDNLAGKTSVTLQVNAGNCSTH